MSKTNHRRQGDKSRKDSERYRHSPLDGAGSYSALSDRTIGTCFGGDNSNGHQGYANAKRGAKKFVRSRVRFHEDHAARESARDALIGDV